jgi:repressor LexA
MAYTQPGRTRSRIYRFMRDRLLAGRPPTVREVQRAFAFKAVQSARAHLEALVAEGLLVKSSGEARGYRLPEGETPALVPLVGRVQAGALTTAFEDPDGYLTVESRFPRNELFALRVRGESMVGASILPDDVVIVHKQPTAESGDIVVAIVDDEATVKRLKIRGGRAELHAENPNFPPIVPKPPDELVILGKVIEVRRYLEERFDPVTRALTRVLP